MICRKPPIFVAPTCCERDIVVTKTEFVVCVFVHPSEFVRTITSTFVNGLQNNLTHFFFPSCVDVPFETFVQVGPISRSYLKVKFLSGP